MGWTSGFPFPGMNSMKDDKVFLDTNILVYAYSTTPEEKHRRAVEILRELWRLENGVLSTQVLQEFFVVVTRKIPKPLDAGTAREIISDLSKWKVVANDSDSILEAIDIHQRHQLSFWDSMIIEAARRGGAKTLLTEDLSNGAVVEGVEIRNPFLH